MSELFEKSDYNVNEKLINLRHWEERRTNHFKIQEIQYSDVVIFNDYWNYNDIFFAEYTRCRNSGDFSDC